MTALHNVKKDFPIFTAHPDLVYLDSAATTHKSKSVLDAMYEFDKTHYGTVHRAVYSLAQNASEIYFDAKKQVASFIGASSQEEVIFTKGTTEAINLLAFCFCEAFTSPGDEIVLTEAEHHSNLIPWQEAAKRHKLILRFAKITENGELDFAHFSSLLSSKTKLVSFAHTSNALGTVFNLKEIVEAAHNVGAKVFVDAAQSIAHSTVEVQAHDIDFLAFSAHKMYGPTGIGVLYGKKDLLAQLPPYQTGGSMVDTVALETTSFAWPPQRFEAGTPMITQACGLRAAIQYLTSIGLSTIAREEQRLFIKLYAGLQSIPKLQIIGNAKERGPLASFSVPSAHSLDIATMLDLKNVAVRSGHLCAEPILKQYGVTHVVRASIGIYNTEEDVDYFLNALEHTLKKLS